MVRLFVQVQVIYRNHSLGLHRDAFVTTCPRCPMASNAESLSIESIAQSVRHYVL
jgi:hypothetical protein